MKKLMLLMVVITNYQMATADEIRGTGPIHVECKDNQGNLKIYNVNRLFYGGNSNQALAAIGFGPNRQDDGMAVLRGDCALTINRGEK
jgi:hypothetical protein